MSDEMKSSQGAARKPHFKPLACQMCWTRQSIVVWELCHSVSLHRAAASEELTNLFLCRDQGKMSATTNDACMHCWHWTEHFSLSVPIQHHQNTRGAKWGANAAGWLKGERHFTPSLILWAWKGCQQVVSSATLLHLCLFYCGKCSWWWLRATTAALNSYTMMQYHSLVLRDLIAPITNIAFHHNNAILSTLQSPVCFCWSDFGEITEEILKK